MPIEHILSVYLAGLTMGHHDFIHKKSLVRFHDGVAWLMQIAMFLALGLLVFPSRLLPVSGAGLLVSAVLVIPEGADVAGKPLVRAKLPNGSLIVLIARGDRYIVPMGSTVLEEGDVVWALLEKDSAGDAISLLTRQASAEILEPDSP